MADHGNLETAGERIESLFEKLGSAPDSNMRQSAEELIQLLTQMYGAALARILQILNEDEASKEFIERLCKDNLVGSLLVLHGLHPENVETRIEGALVRVRPRLDAHGADVKFVKVDRAVAYLRVNGVRDGCATSAASTIRIMLKQALEEAAPEIDAIEVEGLGLDRLWSRDDGISSSAVAKEAQRAARCELCGNPIAETHGHVAEIETRRLLCACRVCRFLFHGNGSARNKRKTVPQRFLCLAESVMTGPQWDELQIPVGLAFFFFNSALNRTVACYPGPAGATESLLSLESWNDIVRTHPVLEELSPDVEALLVDNVKERKSPECYVVPIDACYELVARLRRHWKGFDGGDEARREIEAFFAKLRSQSKEAALAR